MGLISFARRVTPALEWRFTQWVKLPVARSNARRSAAARSIRATRALRPGSNRGSTAHPLVLRFANAYGSPLPALTWFEEELAAVSNGSVRIAFVNNWTTPGNTREETATMIGVTRDHADLGWAGTRAFGVIGVRSMDPLQAPLLLGDYASVGAVFADGVAQEMIAPLDRLGLVGLVALPGPLRKPFAFSRRLLGPRDYKGAKLRSHESLVADETYRALGAEAVVLSVSEMTVQPQARIDGLDIQVEALRIWGFAGSITYNVNLWPRTLAITASRRTYDWLGSSERELLHEAARRTLARSLENLREQEQRDLDNMTPRINPIYASDDQVAGIRDRVEPVYGELRRHPETGPYMERIEAIVDSVA